MSKMARFGGLRLSLSLVVLLLVLGAMGLFLAHPGDASALVGLGALGLLGAGAVWMLAASALTRPVRSLATALEALGQGDMAVQVPAEARDEDLRLLARAFNEAVLAVARLHNGLTAQCAVFESLFRDSLSVMYIVNRSTGRILDANASAEAFYGYSREQLLGMTIHQINDSATKSHRTLLPESMYYRQNHYFYRHRLANGEIRNVELYASPVPGMGNRAYVSIVYDVTERTRIEEELRLAHEDISRLMRSITAILIAVDGEDRVVKWNESAATLFGIASAQALGLTLDELAIPWERERINQGLGACRETHQPLTLERVAYAPAKGQKQTLKINLFPLPVEPGRRPGLLLLGEDITQHEQMQTQLAQSQKLESIGQLAAGIAHEINTPAQYVSSNTTFLQEAAQDIFSLCTQFRQLLAAAKAGPVPQELVLAIEKDMEDRGLEYLEAEVPNAIAQMMEGIQRISTIVHSVKQFAHPGSGKMSPANLNEALRSTVVVSRNEWKHVAELRSDLDPDLPPVSCIIEEINQVVLNLIVNATHAIADALKQDPQRKGLITLSTSQDGAFVDIRVSDNGMGIPPEIQPKIFDPFFTTKEVGQGSGQGLAIARGVVVEKHKGRLFFDTEAGQGTTFHVRLPLEQDDEPQE